MSDKGKNQTSTTAAAAAAAEPAKKRRAPAKRNLAPRHTYIVLTARGQDGQPVPRENIQIVLATQNAHEVVDRTMADNSLTVVKMEAKKRATGTGEDVSARVEVPSAG